MEGGGPGRVLFVSNGYPDFPGSFRGHFVRRMAHGVTALGYRTAVVTPRVYARSPLSEDDAGVRVLRFPFPSGDLPLIQRTSPPLAALCVYMGTGLWTAFRAARSFSCDLVHVHWIVPTGPIGVCAARILGLPVLVHAMGSDVHTYAEGNAFFGLVTRWVLRRAQRVAAVSHDLAERLRRLEPSLGPVAVIPNGIDTKRFEPRSRAQARRDLDLPQDARILLFVGGLIPIKGLRCLARALTPLFEERPDLMLAAAGQGPLGAELTEWAEEHGFPGRLRLLGSVPPERMPRCYHAADAFVLPSLNEGLPNSLLEAMASGLPCVASSVGDIPRVIRHGVNGLLVKPGDAADLTRQIRTVLDLSDGADRMAAEAMASVQAYSEQSMFRRVARIYEELLGRGGP